MKIYFAGTGPADKEGIKKVNNIAGKRLLSFYYVYCQQVQLKIFQQIKDEKVIQNGTTQRKRKRTRIVS